MLVVHRAERTDTLAAQLGRLLADPLPDPFATEVVSVPAKGVERWLSQTLATALGPDGDGVAANIAFPSPTRLLDELSAAAAGVRYDDDPWAPARLTWTLLEVIDDNLDQPWCATLATHLGHRRDDHRAGRRFRTAAHLVELYRSYAAHRPQLFLDWADGRHTDGAGEPLDADLVWQALLWRQLRTRVGTDSPSERLAGTCARLRAEPGLSDLPARLSLFGPTRLSTEQLTVLDALATHRDVHLWLPHASPALWHAVAAVPPEARRREDRTALTVRHPLLASLARENRELQQRLGQYPAEHRHHDGPPPAPTLLGKLQDDLRHDRLPQPGSVPDGTVQVHAGHGAARQVEVLREELLHLFAADESLQPRDVLIMCPDIDTYAPLIQACFGQAALGHPGHQLRVRLADRALGQTNPLIAVLLALLSLAGDRSTASQVLDLAAAPPVRRRFGFDDDDLERIRDWTVATGVHWGLGPTQRAAFGLASVPQNTWATGLDRVLLGVTADESELDWLGTALPLDDVASNDIDLAGRLTEFVDRLAAALDSLQSRQAAGAWTQALAAALDDLAEVPPAEEWMRSQALRELAAMTEHGGDVILGLADLRSMVSRQFAARPTRANFRTGELTVCTMVPMRSVPHRVIALLGLDDEVFPRAPADDGDDVLARDRCLGERDPRSEDRQLLLDAIMAAEQNLLILYTGSDPTTGAIRPPATPVGELLDVLNDMLGSPAGLHRRHPLQPFDARNFDATDPFSFDPGALAAARAASRPKSPVPPLLGAPLPPRTVDVTLADLTAFAVNPTQAFLRQRLGIRLTDDEDDLLDALALQLDGLARWEVGERMLQADLNGVEANVFRQAEWRRGTLPPRRLGTTELDAIAAAVELIADACRDLHVSPPGAVDIELDLGGGRLLTGTVTGIRDGVLVRSSYSRLAAKHRLAAWVNLLAVAAARPDGSWRAVSTGRGQFRPIARSTLVAPDSPLAVLRELVDLRDRGLLTPLPLPTLAAETYAGRRASGSSVADALQAARESFADRFGDITDRALHYVHGTHLSFDDVLGEVPLPDEQSWDGSGSRFAALSTRLWSPLLHAESTGTP